MVCKTKTCWLWEGCLVRKYGGFQVKGNIVKAHRFSWKLHFGEIPDGLLVCHHCDNPICVNPNHLFLGTTKDNADDREAKGRSNPKRGNDHPNSKLTDALVLKMRKMREEKGLSYLKLAKIFNVSTMVAYDAVTKKSWKHV